ncbi:MAG: hypothetical protein ACO22D_05825 [Schleiferiaceae bacterium]
MPINSTISPKTECSEGLCLTSSQADFASANHDEGEFEDVRAMDYAQR